MGILVTKFCGPEVDRTINGKCSLCGVCCSDALPLTPLDISRIKEYVAKNNIQPIMHPPTKGWNPPRDNVCPFFDPGMFNGKHCKIYSVRPIICKHYLCRAYSDPLLTDQVGEAMFQEAMQQAAVRKDPTCLLQPRSMKYAIWPKMFPEYKDTQLIFVP